MFLPATWNDTFIEEINLEKIRLDSPKLRPRYGLLSPTANNVT